MKITSRSLALGLSFVLCFSLSSCVSWLAPSVNADLATLETGQYKLDPNHAALIFKIQHLGLSTYLGRFNQFDASLRFDPQNISTSRLQALVDIPSIDVNNPDLADTLQGSDWFDSQQFPQAQFISQGVNPLADEQFEFYGQLTLHGVTRPVSFIARFHGGADNWMTGKYTLGFSATGTIKRSDFDMASYIPLVGDEVQLEIYAEFLKQ